MKAFGTRTRASLAALLSAALITSGALLAAPAAYAADDAAPAAEAPVAEAPAAAPEEAPVETPAAPEAPVVEAPAPGTPAAEQPAAEQEAAATPPAKAQAGGAAVAGALDASEYGITVSKTTGVENGETLTVNGVLPEKVLDNGTEKNTSIYLMWCVDPGEGARASGAQCDSSRQQWLSGVASPPATQNGTVADGVWRFSTTMTPPASFGAHECLADGGEQCGVFVRLAHTFNGEGTSTQFDQFVPVTFAQTPPPVEYGITVSKTSDVEAGEELTVNGVLPAKILNGGSEKDASIYLIWCVNPGEGNRASGAQCSSAQQQWLSGVTAPPATQKGSVADGVWTFSTTMTPPASFGAHECLADGEEQCGVFVRLAHTFSGEGATQFDQFVPVTFAPTAAETEYGISVAGSVSAVSAGDVLRVSGAFPEKSTAGGSEKNTSVYLMWCVNPGEGNRASGAQCEGSQQWLMHTSEYGQPATGTVADGVWTFDTDFEVPASAFGEHECLADGDEQCGLFVRLAHTFSGEGATQFDQFLPVTFKSTPVAPVQGSASVKKASTSGITVNAALSSLTPGALPNGIQLAVVLRGTSTTATSFVSQRVSVASVSESLNRDLLVSRANLDRSRQYEVVVWTTGATPTTTTLVKVLPFNITSSQWNAVFPPATTPTPGAGSLTWGVSTEFADYINSNIAKGSVNTSGVGGGRGGYVFPQATSGSWNPETRTGTVQYRGSVNFWGHDGAINMTFANPVITVTSPISGTISAGGQTFPLNLASAGFRANADGSVTWSGVSVSGAISGGGGGGGGSVGMDSLSFTVGSVSGANFGSTTTTSPFAQKRTAAATPPATTGITVITPAEDIVAGGEIEITATGFQPNEQGILVVIYSDPTVLDRNAKADENGVVRWIGKLPKNLDGKHTITLQGSINVGQEITVAKADSAKVKEKAAEAAQSSGQQPQAAGGIAPAEGTPAWVWWTAALALLVVAGASTGLVVAQRRRNDAPTHL